MEKEFIVVKTDAGKRLDVFLKAKMPEYSRAFLQRAIENRQALVNGKGAETAYMLKAGDAITAEIATPIKELVANEALSIPVVFENDDLLVINKPAGIAVHPVSFPGGNTVANWLVTRYPAIRSVGDSPLRPGIVHRLDRGTSGVMVVAKTQEMFGYLKSLFKARKVHKEYLAILEGKLEKREGTVEGYLAPSAKDYRKKKFQALGMAKGAKASRTRFVVERYLDGATLVRFFPETGRTHQIRAHAAYLGHPILGDRVYGAKCVLLDSFRHRFFLHAVRLSFPLPDGNLALFEADLPLDFKRMLDEVHSTE